MITAVSQRWASGRDFYRPVGEVMRATEYDVAPIPDDSTAKAFIITHHYSRSYPAARFRFGLYRRGGLVGVAVYSHPSNDRVLALFPGRPTDSAELGRFVLLDSVPANGETWFLARTFELLRRDGLVGVLSFSDPVPRRTISEQLVFPGHIGTIYQAANACYLGRATARSLHLLPDGRVLSDRTIQKLRSGDRGWRYAANLLEQCGAPPLTGDPDRWLNTWLPRCTRRLRHPGNHKYAWILPTRQRKYLPPSLPYPKFSPTSVGTAGMVLRPTG